MEYRDYYQIMGVARTATADEIKKAYRRLARKFHPDVSKEKDAEKKFKEVQEAYDVLKDEEKRRAYDRFGHAGPGANFDPSSAAGGFPGGQGFGGASPFESYTFESGDFGDIFGDLFGRARRAQTGPLQGDDASGTIEVPFRDAVLGGTASLSLRREKEIGSIEAGKLADLAVFEVEDYREIPYYFGVNHCWMTLKRGEIVYRRSRHDFS